MTLRHEFSDAILRAQNARQGIAAGLALDAVTQLHQIIEGPSLSGKSTLAKNYAAELEAQGLAAKNKTQVFDCALGQGQQAFLDMLDAATGGVLLLDNAHLLSREYHGYDPIAPLKVALLDRACVVILSGETAGLAKMTQFEPGLLRHFGTAVTTKKLTTAEIDAYHKEQAEEARRAALSPEALADEDMRRQSAEVWQAMKKVDVAITSAVKPVKTVRFARKEGGR